eukprot:s445_g19.t1
MPLFKLFNRSRPSPAASPKAPAAPAQPQSRRRPAPPAPRAARQPAATAEVVQAPVPTAATVTAVTVAAVQQRLTQVREDLVQPIGEVLDNAYSEDMANILEMLLSEAGTGMEQLQQQVEVCVAEERFDVLEEISTLASEFQDLQRAADRWRAGEARSSRDPLSMTRMTEEAQEAWLREEDERRQQEEARFREQEEAQQRWLEEQAEAQRQEAARQEEEARQAREQAEREMREAEDEQERLAREEADRQMREEEEARIEELEAIRRRVAEEERRSSGADPQGGERRDDFDLQLEELEDVEAAPSVSDPPAEVRTAGPTVEVRLMDSSESESSSNGSPEVQAELRAKRQAEEEELARKRAEAELEAKRQAEEEELARKRAEAELKAKRQAEEEELTRKRAEAELHAAQREAEEEELARKRAEAELHSSQREAEEEELMKKQKEAAQQARRLAQEEELEEVEEQIEIEEESEPHFEQPTVESYHPQTSSQHVDQLPGVTLAAAVEVPHASTPEEETSESEARRLLKPLGFPSSSTDDRSESAEREPSELPSTFLLESEHRVRNDFLEDPWKGSGWAEDLRRFADEELIPDKEMSGLDASRSRQNSWMAEAVEDSWRSALKASHQAAASPSESDDVQRHRAAARFVEAFKDSKAASSKATDVSQGVVFQPRPAAPSKAPASSAASKAVPKALARPKTEEDRIELERSTRKALEDAQFWDLPIEDALRSLRARSTRCKDHTKRVADAFSARQSRKRSAPEKRPEKPRAGAEVWGKRSEPVNSPAWPRDAQNLDTSKAKASQVASIQIKQPFSEISDPDTFSAQFIEAAARAAGIDPRRLRVRAVRAVPDAAVAAPRAPVPVPGMGGRAPVVLGPTAASRGGPSMAAMDAEEMEMLKEAMDSMRLENAKLNRALQSSEDRVSTLQKQLAGRMMTDRNAIQQASGLAQIAAGRQEKLRVVLWISNRVTQEAAYSQARLCLWAWGRHALLQQHLEAAKPSKKLEASPASPASPKGTKEVAAPSPAPCSNLLQWHLTMHTDTALYAAFIVQVAVTVASTGTPPCSEPSECQVNQFASAAALVQRDHNRWRVHHPDLKTHSQSCEGRQKHSCGANSICAWNQNSSRCQARIAWFHIMKCGSSFGATLAHFANSSLPRLAHMPSCTG